MGDVDARVFGRITLNGFSGNGLWICGCVDFKTRFT